jgi:hypothetical protein
MDKNNYISYLSKTTKMKDVLEFLSLLGFEKYDHYRYFYFDIKSREQISSAWAMVLNNEPIEVHVQISDEHTIKDFEILNRSIRQLRKRFGGYFISNLGKNRYLQYDGVVRRKSEAACYIAYLYFKNDVKILYDFLSILKNSESKYDSIYVDSSPLISSTNIGLPFLITIMEDYLRNTYIALLTFSSFKKEIFKNSKIDNSELFEALQSNSGVEEVFARSKSFQSINRIDESFKELIKKLSFSDTLKKYYPKRNYLDKLNQIIEKRHKIIHRFQLNYKYSIGDFERDLILIEKIVKVFYNRIITLQNWHHLPK